MSALWRIGKQHRQVTRTRRASTDYGKSKSEFHSDPERYVLREGFPDFRHALSANNLSILGFDTAEQEYVISHEHHSRSSADRGSIPGEDVISDE
jgi:hypothetical protein